MVLGEDFGARQHVHAAVDPARCGLSALWLAAGRQAFDLQLEIVVSSAPQRATERQLRPGQERRILEMKR